MNPSTIERKNELPGLYKAAKLLQPPHANRLAFYRKKYLTELHFNPKDNDKLQSKGNIKRRNMENAMDKWIGKNTFFIHYDHQFTPQLAMDINECLMNELSTENGHYKAAQREVIEQQMNDLFKKVCNLRITWHNFFEVGSKFLCEFSEIHPFGNANDRTMKLLLCILLKDFVPAPLPLFTDLFQTENLNRQGLNNFQEQLHKARAGDLIPLQEHIINKTHHALQFIISLFGQSDLIPGGYTLP